MINIEWVIMSSGLVFCFLSGVEKEREIVEKEIREKDF